MTLRPITTGHLNSINDSADFPSQSSAALDAEQVINRIGEAIGAIDGVRDRLTDLYRQARPGTVVEVEIGDALQSVRAAMKRLRKAREELLMQPLPGMEP